MTLSFFGTEVRTSGELRFSRLTTDDAARPASASRVGRAFAALAIERPFDRNRLVLQTSAAVVGADGAVPPQESLYAGGPVSAPGYRFHELVSMTTVSQRLEWRSPIPAPAIPLGRFGTVPGSATIAPFVYARYARRALATDVEHPTGVYPSAGVSLQPFFDLMRLQLARGLRNGRWAFDIDVSHDFWPIL